MTSRQLQSHTFRLHNAETPEQRRTVMLEFLDDLDKDDYGRVTGAFMDFKAVFKKAFP